MRSTMQFVPMSVAQILLRGSTVHGHTEVSTWTDEGREVTTFSEIGARAAALAHVLTDLGITGDQRVASFLWNCSEHLEFLLGVPSMGAVFHPLNTQLVDDQIGHLIRHAEDDIIVTSPRYGRRLGAILHDCETVRHVLFIGTDREAIAAAATHLPASVTAHSLEALLDGKPTTYDWPEIKETDGAVMCYSTGTTGAPKGVVYSHRSLYLHSMGLRATDSFAVNNGTKFLCCVPIYHVLSWGVPLAAFACGAPLVFPGRDASAEALVEIIATDHPRQASGVPTIWIALAIAYAHSPGRRMSLLEIFAGGSPVPPALIKIWEERFGVDVIHVWGMTETSPIGTVARPPQGASGETRWSYRTSQGRFPPSLKFRLADDDGNILPSSDRVAGELQVRGNWVTGEYYHSPASEPGGPASVFRGQPVDDAERRFTADGWLITGDVGTVSSDGFLTVSDRKRDVIKSGGEWIYSVQLEHLIMEDPRVVECAVIGVPDEKWGERPMACTSLLEGVPATDETARELRAALTDKLPRWMLPEYWTFVDSIDKTSVGKFDKKDLRAHYASGNLAVIKLRGPGERAQRMADLPPAHEH